MRSALSMYLGGIEIYAEESTYETSREMGCVCSSCKSPVFLRSGTIRNARLRNGKKVIQKIPPTFVHYRSTGLELECEKRHLSKGTQLKIATYKSEGKKQRLELYNRHLWVMIRDSTNIEKQELAKTRKLAGDKYIKEMINLAMVRLTTLANDAVIYLDQIIDVIKRGKTFCNHIFSSDSEDPIKKENVSPLMFSLIASDFDYCKNPMYERLHRDICIEVLDFLQTKSSRYVWKNLMVHILTVCGQVFRKYYNCNDFSHFKIAFHRDIINGTDNFLDVICGLIYSVLWVEEVSANLKTDILKLTA